MSKSLQLHIPLCVGICNQVSTKFKACACVPAKPILSIGCMHPCRHLATCTPSLANLVSQMLKRNLRQEGAPHDCEQDAAAAMQLVIYAIQHGVPPPMEAPQVKASAPCHIDLAISQVMQESPLSSFTAMSQLQINANRQALA